MPSSTKSSSSSRKELNAKFSKSRSKANAIGYEKRQARKAKTNVSAADVYEHIPEKTKRSNIRPELDREEAWEFGENIDEASQGQREAIRTRLVGENADDEEIASGDDEEIESDDAFEESDEERFASFFSSKKSQHAVKLKDKSTVRFAEVDLNEEEKMDPRDSEDSQEEDEEEVGDDDESMNLVDVLDGKEDIDVGSDKGKKSQTKSDQLSFNDVVEANMESRSGEDSAEEDDEVGDDEDEEVEMAFAPSENEEVPSSLEQLQTFVSNLDVTAKKRKAPDVADGTAVEGRTRKRRVLQEQTEAGEESEFHVRSSGVKLNLDDLLAPLAGQSSTLQSLKKTTKVLALSGSSKSKTLSAPLPQRAQERLDREAAYEQTKQEVDKWSETMKRIREAEHLSFPLQAQSSGKLSNLELSAKFKPTTDLERSVDNLLKSSKLREEDIYQKEENMLTMNKFSVEEIAQRRNELRQMRELMFRAEVKSRRVKKIKSKTYRRLKRKEKERLGELIDEKGPEDDSETEEGRLKRETERAKERATLRHKHTGKWAKRMTNREDVDEGTRKDLEDMLSRGEKLRRRIQGVASDQSDQESSDEEIEGSDVEESIARIKQGAFDELAKLGEEEIAESDGKTKGKSVFEMKFMKDAMTRQAATVNKELDDFTKEMGGTVVNDIDDEASEVPEKDSPNGVIAVRTGGRVVYRPGDTQSIVLSKTNSLAPPPSETSSVTLKSTDLLSPPPPSPLLVKQLQPPASAPLSQEVNPWLVRDGRLTGKIARTKNAVVVSKDSKALDKAKHRLGKQASKNQDERAKALDDATVQISLDNVLRLPTSSVSKVPQGEDESGEESEIEAQENTLLIRKGKGKANRLAFHQRDLVALAFAGDNVVPSFEEAKRREIAADAPREVDTTIPGWGSWGGTGIRKVPPKPERIKVIPGIDPTTRADHGKKNIIISEKRDKKVAKYLVKDLPYPYTSKAQFERTMGVPLGTEWNTRVAFQRGTLPRIVKKPGVIIEPLQKLSS